MKLTSTAVPLLALLLLGGSAAADPAPVRLLDAGLQPARVLAASALSKMAEAGDDIRGERLNEAVDALSQARLMLDLIRTRLTTGEARALLHYLRAQLGQEDNQAALADLLPLSGALDRLPPGAVRDHALTLLEQAKLALETPDHGKAVQALEQMDKTLVLDRIDLPLDAAEDQINQALGQILEKHTAPDPTLLMGGEKNLLQLLHDANA